MLRTARRFVIAEMDMESSAEMQGVRKERVCVTGAGGFIGSWVVKLLLSKGYIVHGTVRSLDPNDEKCKHLMKLEKAPDNLKLFKADLLDIDSFRSAVEGCTGVLHLACPLIAHATDPEAQMLRPTINGTLNVLKACSEAKVKRVVHVSSMVAVTVNPSWPVDKAMDEACWTDLELCRKDKMWYYLAKTEAEATALDYSKKNRLDVVSVCPGATIGPLMVPVLTSSAAVLVDFVQGKDVPLGDSSVGSSVVDVRDAAAAIVLAYEKPEAEGRYICTAHNIKVRDLTETLKALYPDLRCTDKFEDQRDSTLSSVKLQNLGWTFRPLEETLVDTIESYRSTGLLKL